MHCVSLQSSLVFPVALGTSMSDYAEWKRMVLPIDFFWMPYGSVGYRDIIKAVSPSLPGNIAVNWLLNLPPAAALFHEHTISVALLGASDSCWGL